MCFDLDFNYVFSGLNNRVQNHALYFRVQCVNSCRVIVFVSAIRT